MASIRFEKVSKRFAVGGAAVDGLDLTIDDQELFTFVGPSGCGKSTALNLIAGLERETEGRILFGDREVGHLDPKDRDVAMVFQSYALYPHLSVYENVAFPLRIRKRPQEEIERSIREISQTVGIEALLSRRPKELSGGQRQRVALARALVRRPQVFLMDEPLSNLDARLRLEMRGEIKRIHAAYRITTVYVTHDQEEAMVLSDRIAVMSRGKIQQCAPPAEVYRRPANRFVAEFIGTPPINVVEGATLARAGGFAAFLGERAEKVDCGLRPEHLLVTSEPTGLSLRGQLAFVEMTGRESWAHVDWEGVRLTASMSGTLEAGATVTLSIDPERVLLFDEATGTRL
jgi:multiple sugar transport system ATP-binding protein